MKDMNISSVYKRRYKPVKSSKTSNEEVSNNIKDAQVEASHHFVATDITYIHTQKDGWVYQITFIDLYTRKILHYGVLRTMDDVFVSSITEIVLKKYKNIQF